MDPSNRREVRADVVTKLKAYVPALADDGTTNHVVDHLPKDLRGISPLVSVESGSMQYALTTELPDRVGLIIGVWVRRDNAQAAEDQLDDLAQAIMTVLRGHYNAAQTRPSEPMYDETDGIEYRIEFWPVEIDWTG